MPVAAGDGGKGRVLTTHVGAQADLQFKRFGGNRTLGVFAMGAVGKAQVKLEPDGGTASESSGPSLDLAGGLVLRLPQSNNIKFSHLLMIGGELWRAASDLGDFNGVGATTRYRWGWSPFNYDGDHLKVQQY